MAKLPWYTIISDHVAAEIVQKTRAPKSQPVNVKVLARDLNRAFFIYRTDVSVDVRSRAHAYKKLELITSKAKALRNALKNLDEVGPYIMHATLAVWRLEQERYEDLLTTLQRPFAEMPTGANDVLAIVFSVIDLLVKGGELAIAQPSPARLLISPISQLIAERLPTIYETHFGRPFGAGSSGEGLPEGPGIRFVLAFLNAASITRQNGKPYSKETVRTYWQKIGRGKLRRTSDKVRKKN